MNGRHDRAVIAALAAILMLLAPGAGADDATVAPPPVDVPCEALDGIPGSARPRTDEDRWRFQLTGRAVDGGAFMLDVASTSHDIGPNGTLHGDAFSRFHGTLVTDAGVHDVSLVWERDARNAHVVAAQVALRLVLAGTAVAPDGRVLPLELDITFAGAPLVCAASAHVFNDLHVCPDPDTGVHACVPFGWQVTTALKAYHNGPVAFTGTLDGVRTQGTGHGHGSAHLGTWGRAPL